MGAHYSQILKDIIDDAKEFSICTDAEDEAEVCEQKLVHYVCKSPEVGIHKSEVPLGIVGSTKVTSHYGASAASRLPAYICHLPTPPLPTGSGPAVSLGPRPTKNARRVDRSKTTAKAQREHAGGNSESDALESRLQGQKQSDEQMDAVQLVSLGCYCGVKSSFQSLGRGSEHMPFDWMRTSIDGLLHLIRSDFDGFFAFVPPAHPIKGQTCVLYRHYHHSFWHDNPTDPAMVSKYERRMDRFNSINASSKQVLFVRAVCDTTEVLRAPELLAELKEAFGSNCLLLMVLDFQRRMRGAAVVQGHPDILFYFNPSDAHNNPDTVYVIPVQRGLEWAVGRTVSGPEFNSLQEAASATDKHTAYYAYDHWVFEGMGVDGVPLQS
mmetsp:Transcript_31952/g.74826  ORF Transcript_31952/g.74826 Transcript_31952/m.74826 type:complete len:381 (+) Transcript_31952:74-1216(+)